MVLLLNILLVFKLLSDKIEVRQDGTQIFKRGYPCGKVLQLPLERIAKRLYLAVSVKEIAKGLFIDKLNEKMNGLTNALKERKGNG